MGRRKKSSTRRKKRKLPRLVGKIFRVIGAVLILSGALLFLFLFLDGTSDLLGRATGALDSMGDFVSLEMPEELEDEKKLNREGLESRDDVVLRVGLFADSEGHNENLTKALDIMEDLSVDGAFFLGDLTQWGSSEELREGKAILDQAGFELSVLPGDHDLAASVAEDDLLGRSKFLEFFGEPNQVYEKGGYKFVLLDNSANFSPLEDSAFDWFSESLDGVDFVVLSQPLYHPTNPRVMGVVDGQVVSTVKYQAEQLLELIRDSDVRAVIAADQHYFSNNPDPESDNLRHIAIGALVSNSPELRSPQSPRLAVLEIYSDDTYKVSEVLLR
jgi:predicted phosphodiesterase